MQSSDRHRFGGSLSVDGAGREAERSAPAQASRFRSILFEAHAAPALAAQAPVFFADVNLDQVLGSITAGREEYELEPLFYTPLRDVEAVRYRQEVIRELERTEVREPVVQFGDRMSRMRMHLAHAEKLYYELEQQSWFLEAIEIYCEAVRSLAGDLRALELDSCGLRGLCSYLSDYVSSDEFTALAAETNALREAFSAVRYRLRIEGSRVTVTRYEDAGDYSAEVQATFARFQQGAVRSYLLELRDSVGMNHVEAQILQGVAKLHHQLFAKRADYCTRHRGYLDATVARFDKEVQLFLGYLELIERLRGSGLPFCYPDVSTRSKQTTVEEGFDLALAAKLVPDRNVVCNDLRLQGQERIFVITGPNNGGKTTLARMFGQLHHLASLGLPVPGSATRLFLPDQIYTHFEREEDIETLRGKLEDELVRVNAILEQATSQSVIVMNESFSSTSLNDALFVGTEVMRRIIDLDCLGAYVTFVDEIASLSESTVSMVSEVVPDDPARRTFKLVRRPADGLAYAWAIAQKYGLTYERLMERIGQ